MKIQTLINLGIGTFINKLSEILQPREIEKEEDQREVIQEHTKSTPIVAFASEWKISSCKNIKRLAQ